MNEIVKSNSQSNIQELMSMATLFAESGMFADAQKAAQAFVKIQAGNEIGIPPFQSMSGIHIIKGKTTIGAGVIASMVKGSGKYDYRVVESTDKICSIDFYQKTVTPEGPTNSEMIGNSTFTIEDARKAGTQNLDKFPKNMLFARAISNGVKFYAPDVFSGPVYTPEEVNSIEQPVKEETAQFEIIDPMIDAIEKLILCKNTDEFEMLLPMLTDEVLSNPIFLSASKLIDCNSVEDLTKYKKTLEKNIVTNVFFKQAATAKYNEIIAPKTTQNEQ
jgi:hypothetical protein